MDQVSTTTLVNNYIEQQLDFSEWEITSAQPRVGKDNSYEVKVTLRNSPQAEEEIVNKVSAEDQEMWRDLFTGDFKATFTIVQGIVRNVEFHGIDLD